MKVLKVNEHLTLTLESGKTNIYVNGETFDQTKFLLLNVPLEKVCSFNEIDSIDQATEKLDRSMEKNKEHIDVTPEVEFWRHSNNLQVWAENNYNR